MHKAGIIIAMWLRHASQPQRAPPLRGGPSLSELYCALTTDVHKYFQFCSHRADMLHGDGQCK